MKASNTCIFYTVTPRIPLYKYIRKYSRGPIIFIVAMTIERNKAQNVGILFVFT